MHPGINLLRLHGFIQKGVYEVLREDGIKEHVFLLDEQLKIEGIGLVSQNLAEKRARLRASQSVLPRRH